MFPENNEKSHKLQRKMIASKARGCPAFQSGVARMGLRDAITMHVEVGLVVWIARFWRISDSIGDMELNCLRRQRICEKGFGRIVVTSGIGVREYYRRQGHARCGAYMVKRF